MALGTRAQLINAKQVLLRVTNDTWTFVQVLDVQIGHPEIREPSTSGTQYYYGDHDNSIDFEVLATEPNISKIVALGELNSNSFPTDNTFTVQWTTSTGDILEMTVVGHFAPNIRFHRDLEGAAKANVKLRITTDVTSADVASV